jgi:hypothetical protein
VIDPPCLSAIRRSQQDSISFWDSLVIDAALKGGAELSGPKTCNTDVCERHAQVKSLPPARRHDYFLEHARSSLETCRRAKLPAQFTEGVEQWLEQLQRPRP